MKANNFYLTVMLYVVSIILLPPSYVHAQTLNFESFNATNPMTSQFNHTLALEKQARQYYLNDTQTAKAIKLAENSIPFQSLSKGYNYTFPGNIAARVYANHQGGLTLMGYDVGFELYKGPIILGNASKGGSVFVDPTLTKVYNVTSYEAVYNGFFPATVPEFPFALPILVISLASLLIFYRIKFKIKHTKSVL